MAQRAGRLRQRECHLPRLSILAIPSVIAAPIVDAIKRVQRHLRNNRDSTQALILRQLLTRLADEAAFPLAQLHALGLPEFELAMQLLDERPLDQYYAERLRLLDGAAGREMTPG